VKLAENEIKFATAPPIVVDYYKVTAKNDEQLKLETRTPANQVGEFVNTLHPMLRLYDSAGNLVAEDAVGAKTGLDAFIKYKIPANSDGIFYIEALAATATATPTKGEYILSIEGTVESPPPFVVTATTPADHALTRTPPSQVTVTFSDGIY